MSGRAVACLWILLAAVAAPALAQAGAAAPALSVPAAPPGMLGCAAGWQTGARTIGFDHGAGFILETDYDLARRAGQLLRRDLDAGGGAGGAAIGGPLAGPVRWNAAPLLDGGTPAPAARRIVTLSGAGATVPFTWNALDSKQQAALDPASDGAGPARVDYVRGERSGEGGAFRQRASLLGDIVRSTPLLVGAPAADSLGGGYPAFYQRFRQRDPLVYVGANDGMLHAFDWNTGAERFAYVPASLIPKLAQFADPASTTHLPLIDGALAQLAAVIDGQWRTVLVGGMGMGGAGLFALDVTDPVAGPRVLWEFSGRDDAAIGHVHAAPQIVKLRSSGTRTARAERYFALVSSGWNPSAGNDGALLLLAVDKPAGETWRRGENYHVLGAPARDPGAPNALAAPVVMRDSDGVARFAWAGDLQGSLWRFSLDGLLQPNAGGGGAARTAGRAVRVFQARSSDGAPQPIAAQPQLVFAPGGGVLVLFGTGASIEMADVSPSSFSPQSFYAVRDMARWPPDAASGSVPGRAALAERRLVPGGGSGAYVVEGEQFDYNGSGGGVRQGWYFDYPRAAQDGERTATTPQLSGNAVLITTSAPAAQPCAPTVRAYMVDTLTGLARDRRGVATPGALTGRAMDGSNGRLPLLLAATAPASAALRDPTGMVRGLRSVAIFDLPLAGAGALLDEVRQYGTTGRLSWREIVNWRELHANGPPASPPSAAPSSPASPSRR